MFSAKQEAAAILLAGGLALAQPRPARLATPGHDASKTQVLLLTGYNSTANHHWREIDPALRQILERTRQFEVRVDEEPAGMTADTLAPYQLLLIDYSDYIPQLGRTWPPSTREAYLEYLKRGGGVVAFHVTVGSFPEWPEFHRTLGIADNHAIGHGPYHTFTVRMGAPDSALAGIPAKFDEWGEIYNGIELLPQARVLARAWDDPKNCAPGRVSCGSGKNEPILWMYQYGAGRVFVTTLGHDQRSINVPGFQTSLLRGAKWAARTGANAAKSLESGE